MAGYWPSSFFFLRFIYALLRGGIIMVNAYKYLQIEISTYSMEFSLCVYGKNLDLRKAGARYSIG